MNKLTFFEVGETYTNDQIRFSLDLENLGGIRPSLDSNRNLRHVAILTAELRIEARRLIVAQGLAAGEPPQELNAQPVEE